MRELEGLSYREIGERLELSRPAVESTLFRARRRLEREYREIEAGRRCEAIAQAIARLAEGIGSPTDRRGLSRHARRCSSCSGARAR
jgi:DNA-binding CsgD family transcriptional regulator